VSGFLDGWLEPKKKSKGIVTSLILDLVIDLQCIVTLAVVFVFYLQKVLLWV